LGRLRGWRSAEHAAQTLREREIGIAHRLVTKALIGARAERLCEPRKPLRPRDCATVARRVLKRHLTQRFCEVELALRLKRLHLIIRSGDAQQRAAHRVGLGDGGHQPIIP
jgi:hypothetical protein